MKRDNNRCASTYHHITNNCGRVVIFDCRLSEQSFRVGLDVLLNGSQKVANLEMEKRTSNNVVMHHHSSGRGNVATNERISRSPR